MVDAKIGRESSFRTGFSQIAASLTLHLLSSRKPIPFGRGGCSVEKEKRVSPKNVWNTDATVLDVFKMDHMQQLWANFALKIFQLFHFHTGGPFLIPQKGQYWEKRFHPNLKLDDTESIGCLGHSNWTIFSHLSLFCSKIFPTFSLSYWGPILITPEGQ